MNIVRHDKGTPFETKSRYCRAERQGLPCQIVVPNLIHPVPNLMVSNVVLLPCLILEFSSARHERDVWHRPKSPSAEKLK